MPNPMSATKPPSEKQLAWEAMPRYEPAEDPIRFAPTRPSFMQEYILANCQCLECQKRREEERRAWSPEYAGRLVRSRSAARTQFYAR